MGFEAKSRWDLILRVRKVVGNAKRAGVRSQHCPQLPQRSDSIPKGLRHEAQGCEARATLGEPAMASQPQRGCDQGENGDGRRRYRLMYAPLRSDATPSGLRNIFAMIPE